MDGCISLKLLVQFLDFGIHSNNIDIVLKVTYKSILCRKTKKKIII